MERNNYFYLKEKKKRTQHENAPQRKETNKWGGIPAQSLSERSRWFRGPLRQKCRPKDSNTVFHPGVAGSDFERTDQQGQHTQPSRQRAVVHQPS